MMADSSVTART